MQGTILVVDDEQPIADILKFNLEKEATRSFAPLMESVRWISRLSNSQT